MGAWGIIGAEECSFEDIEVSGGEVCGLRNLHRNGTEHNLGTELRRRSASEKDVDSVYFLIPGNHQFLSTHTLSPIPAHSSIPRPWKIWIPNAGHCGSYLPPFALAPHSKATHPNKKARSKVGADGREGWGMKHGMQSRLRGLWMDRGWLLNLVRVKWAD